MSLKEESVLMNDAGNRGNFESVMSCIVAWTLKMCDENHHKGHVDNVLLHECRKILSKLIGKDVTQLSCGVETYLEWKKIDLVAEVYLKEIDEYHVFLFENKVCAGLPSHELPTNKKVFHEYYDTERKYIPHHILLCAYIVPDYMAKQCKEEKFEALTLETLTDYNAPDTGNAIFDEFWRRSW